MFEYFNHNRFSVYMILSMTIVLLTGFVGCAPPVMDQPSPVATSSSVPSPVSSPDVAPENTEDPTGIAIGNAYWEGDIKDVEDAYAWGKINAIVNTFGGKYAPKLKFVALIKKLEFVQGNNALRATIDKVEPTEGKKWNPDSPGVYQNREETLEYIDLRKDILILLDPQNQRWPIDPTVFAEYTSAFESIPFTFYSTGEEIVLLTELFLP